MEKTSIILEPFSGLEILSRDREKQLLLLLPQAALFPFLISLLVTWLFFIFKESYSLIGANC